MRNRSVDIIGTSPRQLTVALIGLGGYAENYLRGLLDESTGSVQLIAGVDPEPHRCRRMNNLVTLGIPIYTDIERAFERHLPDLAVIATPAYLHKPHSCLALAQGVHVLCEKPAATTLPDALAMRDAQAQANRLLAIGYQWSFSSAIQALKSDIIRGLFGAPRRFRSLVVWPRTESYYRRNSWAGQICGPDGEPIYDNPVSNGCSHHIHNLLYLLGTAKSSSIWPESIECEIYRANDIASFDTAVMRLRAPGDTEVFVIASHAATTSREPTFQLEFEDATVAYDQEGQGRLVARVKNGMIRDYGSLPSGSDIQKLWIAIDAIRSGGEIPCGIVAAVPHVAIVSALHQCEITPIPPLSIQSGSQRKVGADFLHGLGEDLARCYEQWSLPSELRLSWSGPKRYIAIAPDKLVATTIPPTLRKEHFV